MVTWCLVLLSLSNFEPRTLLQKSFGLSNPTYCKWRILMLGDEVPTEAVTASGLNDKLKITNTNGWNVHEASVALQADLKQRIRDSALQVWLSNYDKQSLKRSKKQKPCDFELRPLPIATPFIFTLKHCAVKSSTDHGDITEPRQLQVYHGFFSCVFKCTHVASWTLACFHVCACLLRWKSTRLQ